MCAGCSFFCLVNHSVGIQVLPCDWAYTHSTSIAKTIIGMRFVTQYPLAEATTIATFRVNVLAALGVQTHSVVCAMEQCVGNGHGTDGVIGKAALIGEKFKVIVVGGIEFKAATHDVANNCS